jgi:hypothetical protein
MMAIDLWLDPLGLYDICEPVLLSGSHGYVMVEWRG